MDLVDKSVCDEIIANTCSLKERKKKGGVSHRIKAACRDKKQCLRGEENNFHLKEVREEQSGKRSPKGQSTPGRYKE